MPRPASSQKLGAGRFFDKIYFGSVLVTVSYFILFRKTVARHERHRFANVERPALSETALDSLKGGVVDVLNVDAGEITAESDVVGDVGDFAGIFVEIALSPNDRSHSFCMN